MKRGELLRYAANAIADSRAYARKFNFDDLGDRERGELLGQAVGELMKLKDAVEDWFQEDEDDCDGALVAALYRTRDALEAL